MSSAPSICVQLCRCRRSAARRNVKVAAGSLQLPGSTVKVEPTIASPLSEGAVTTVGGPAGRRARPRFESALPVPPAFVAVTVDLDAEADVVGGERRTVVSLAPSIVRAVVAVAVAALPGVTEGRGRIAPATRIDRQGRADDRVTGDGRRSRAVGAAGTTTPVGTESALFAPPLFDAVTSTWRESPRSSVVMTYLAPVAPSIVRQTPSGSQRCQAKVNVASGSVQLPGSAVSCSPTTASPETVGAPRSAGGPEPRVQPGWMPATRRRRRPAL